MDIPATKLYETQLWLAAESCGSDTIPPLRALRQLAFLSTLGLFSLPMPRHPSICFPTIRPSTLLDLLEALPQLQYFVFAMNTLINPIRDTSLTPATLPNLRRITVGRPRYEHDKLDELFLLSHIACPIDAEVNIACRWPKEIMHCLCGRLNCLKAVSLTVNYDSVHVAVRSAFEMTEPTSTLLSARPCTLLSEPSIYRPVNLIIRNYQLEYSHCGEPLFRCMRDGTPAVLKLSSIVRSKFASDSFRWEEFQRVFVGSSGSSSWPLPERLSIRRTSALNSFASCLWRENTYSRAVPILADIKELDIRGIPHCADADYLVKPMQEYTSGWGLFDHLVVEEDDLVCAPVLRGLEDTTRDGGFKVMRHYELNRDEEWQWPW